MKLEKLQTMNKLMYDEYYIKRKYKKTVPSSYEVAYFYIEWHQFCALLHVFAADSFLILSGRGFKCGSQLMAEPSYKVSWIILYWQKELNFEGQICRRDLFRDLFFFKKPSTDLFWHIINSRSARKSNTRTVNIQIIFFFFSKWCYSGWQPSFRNKKLETIGVLWLVWRGLIFCLCNLSKT
jgi:hypothetical protein